MAKKICLMLAILLLGMLAGYYAGKHAKSDERGKAVSRSGKTIKYWVAPMDPSYRRDKPGKSPMGMDLVPVYDDAGPKSDDAVVKIDPAVIANLGVVTAKAKQGVLARSIDTVGYVEANQDNIENVHSYINGWVRNLRISASGDKVEKGQVLFELYSPSLVNAQQELLLALKNNNRALISAGKKKLRTLGFNTAQIRHLQSHRRVKQQIPVFAASSGVVSQLNIRDGMYIKPESSLMVIEDLTSVWIRVEVYEKQVHWVAAGQVAEASFSGLPGRLWQGEVIYIYPTLDKLTHTLAVRLKFPNPNLVLKPDMYASVKIFVPSAKKAILIPSRAVIPTEQGARVILALGHGRFKPVEVTVGVESDGETAILKGLSDGDAVVVSGQFLIDSESNMTAGMARLRSDKMMKHGPPKSVDAYNQGVLLAIDPLKQRITLSHRPIQHLGMPEMVMEVSVSPSIDLKRFKVGQKVRFKWVEYRPQHYRVVSLNTLGAQ